MGDVDPRSLQRLARVTGVLYLVLVVCGMFSPIVLESLLVPGDAATTAQNITGSLGVFRLSLISWIVIVVADAAISVTFYLLLKPVSHALSLVAAALRVVYTAMLAASLVNVFDAFLLLTGGNRGPSLDPQQLQSMALAALVTFSAGFLLALVIFGAHLLVLGGLFYRSRYVPRVFGVLLIAAGAGYVVDSLANFFVADYPSLASMLLLAPAVLGEVGLMVWLLAKGVQVRRTTLTSLSHG